MVPKELLSHLYLLTIILNSVLLIMILIKKGFVMITIGFGSETGTAEELAEKTKAHLESKGLSAELFVLEDLSLDTLTSKTTFIVITSTWGDGEPPTNAISFAEALEASGSIKLPELKFSVLALGDTAYPEFCKFGRDVDEQLEGLGATRLLERQDCDIDFESDYEAWLQSITDKLSGVLA